MLARHPEKLNLEAVWRTATSHTAPKSCLIRVSVWPLLLHLRSLSGVASHGSSTLSYVLFWDHVIIERDGAGGATK